MYNLRLIKGKSYLGIVYATEAEPLVSVPTKEEADYLVGSGFFELLGNLDNVQEATTTSMDVAEEVSLFAEDEEIEETEEYVSPDVMGLQSKTKSELIEYANARGIDIAGCKTKDDIFSKIVEAIASADDVRNALRG